MNLDSCTIGQRSIITTMDSPLMVSAGAGSGKTFTLTQRIAYALSEPGPTGQPYCSSVDEVMAITFTKKAAAELKSRIKHELASIGLEEEALKVDDAWISTIHGMCSRVLREHALELGFDPNFEVIEDTEANALKVEAFDRVIESIRDTDAGLRAFIEGRDVNPASSSSASLAKQTQRIIDRVTALPDGFGSLVLTEPTSNPSALLRKMIELGEEFLDASRTLAKPGTRDLEYREQMERALESAEAYLGHSVPCTSFTDQYFDAGLYAQVFFSFPKTNKRYANKESAPAILREYREEYAALGSEVAVALAQIELNQLVEVAQRIHHEYYRLKGNTKLDNNDLLRFAYNALVHTPELAKEYRDRFKLIMVDEFQDTDQLQVALISAIAQPGLANVCTVGDAQQSIYRFRGADVNVFFDYRDNLKANSDVAQFVSLPDNFRSHADVLSCVDAIFSQEQAFGDEFLQLAPKGAVNSVADDVFAQRPRINLALFDYRTRSRSGTDCATSADARTLCAKRIAHYFADLRDAGVSPSEMVLLMGGMSSVDVYAQALREAGFECLVAGGSTFSKAAEVDMFQAVLRYFRNCGDDEALYQVLDSPLFNLSSTALLYLGTGTNPQGQLMRRDLSVGFSAWPRERGLTGLAEVDEDALDFAHLCLQGALRVCAEQGLSAGVRMLLRSSGYLMRLEQQGAEGQAIAGNLSKALRMLEAIEAEGQGLARSVERFCADIDALKLGPGSLSTTSSNFVQIMTVHASKGLQFDHVAVAELTLDGSPENLVVENIKGKTFATLKPRSITKNLEVSKTLKTLREWASVSYEAQSPLEAETVEEGEALLRQYAYDQELAEARRKLYVALTRAVKSLFVGVVKQGNKDFEYRGVLADLHSAFKWECSEEAPRQMLEYGGSAPARFEFTVLRQPVEFDQVDEGEALSFLIPAAPIDEAVYCTLPSFGERDTFSSTALHEDIDYDEEALIDDELERSEDEDPFALGNAFHRLAQRAVLECNGSDLKLPSEEAVAAQITQQHISEPQAVRLRGALQRWFGSAVAQQLVAHGVPQAEVPFMVAIPIKGETKYLEGEIDAVSFDEAGNAFLVDYKTGGFASETDEQLHAKHLQQAQCYALALLKQGSPSVKATFVRVEHDDPAVPGQPQTVVYEFTSEDSAELEAGIAAAYLRSLA